jgi:hypothetical protein
MANDGWVRRDPRTGQRQKRGWIDETFDCLTTVVALAAVGLLALVAVVGAIVKVAVS